MAEVLEKSITEYLDEDYRRYALYVVEERAIPSVIDGLKPTARKVIYVANKNLKEGKIVKVGVVAGMVMSDAHYNHGDCSDTIITMAQEFRNNLPLLGKSGQFGTRRNPTAASARYLKVSLHPNFKKLYKDFELLTPKMEEGEKIEPEYFLPIIPTVLLNGSKGIAVGFATNILNRDPLDLIEACEAAIKGKKIPDLLPHYPGFEGYIDRDPEDPQRFLLEGDYKIINTTTVEVTELPPYTTYEDYEKTLVKLEEADKISSYDNQTKAGKIKYIIKFQRKVLQDYVKKGKLADVLKMKERKRDNLVTLDEHGNVKEFSNTSDLVKYFVNFRIKYVEKRKEFLIKELERQLMILSNRARFIKYIIEDKIKIKKTPKAQIIAKLDEFKFDKVDGSYEYLLRMPIHSLTKETYEKLLKEVDEAKAELERTKKLVPSDMYLDDLKELKKAIK